MSWWLWFVAAFGLGIIEVLAPGYIFLGFALAAAVMGLLALMGVHLSLPAAVAASGASGASATMRSMKASRMGFSDRASRSSYALIREC